MNLKKLSSFILVLGIAILAYGGFKYATNHPVKFDPSKSEMTIFGRDEITNLMEVQSEN